MQRYLVRPTPLIHRNHNPPTAWLAARFATASQHPNPGNFANRSKAQLSRAGRKGGHKGGKAKGVGGFHNMDPEKQHEIASRGGRAVNKATNNVAEQHARERAPRGRQPSTAPPGFEPTVPA